MEFILKELTPSITITKLANVHFFEFPAEFYTQTDNHDFYELIFVSSGKLYVSSEDYSGTLKKQQMIIHRPNESHSLKCDAGLRPVVIIIGFQCSSNCLDKFSCAPITLEASSIKKLAEIVKEGRNLFSPPYDVPLYDMKKKKHFPFGSEQMLKNLLECFLLSLIRATNDSISENDNVEIDNRFDVYEIVSYINDNYLEKATIDELSFMFGTNRSTLCKSFKEYTKKTITEYINAKKLECAKQIITQTTKTITEISEQLKFENIHYFTRFFKKHTGLSPVEYRKEFARNDKKLTKI